MLTEKQFIRGIIENVIKISIILILGATGVGIFSNLIHKISNSIYEKESLALLLEKRNENLNNLKTELEKIGNADESIESAFPTSDNILEFVSAMEGLASTYSVKQNLKFGNSVPAPELTTANLEFLVIDYNLSVTANITVLINYLKEFENLSYFTTINSVAISSPSNWFSESQITIQAKLYLKK